MYAFLKKRYGQNFLIDQNILRKISNLIKSKDLNIYEIGPGDGKLTEKIIENNPRQLTIIEIDKDLIPILKTKFSKFSNLTILNKDILDTEINIDCDTLVSNLPYNISSQILVKICTQNQIPENCILMFQKEFAERLLESKLNSLNSLVNCFYDIKKEFYISKNCFRPIPKIDSAVLNFTKKKNFLIQKSEIMNFIEFKRKIFSHKRKTLKNILKNSKINFDDINLEKRAEELNLNYLIEIFRKVNDEIYLRNLSN